MSTWSQRIMTGVFILAAVPSGCNKQPPVRKETPNHPTTKVIIVWMQARTSIPGVHGRWQLFNERQVLKSGQPFSSKSRDGIHDFRVPVLDNDYLIRITVRSDDPRAAVTCTIGDIVDPHVATNSGLSEVTCELRISKLWGSTGK